ncbi:unnamed protein product [Bemisia tabaci]|uniref:Uncharacterized protein n=1 Tax=Bemisia tabaci TaxID=7038 RepID=A0A9P0ANR2_BEMTA|nr:unnamed protein product [Bemisia tabaci]
MSTEAKEILSDIYGVHKSYKLSQSEVKSMPMTVVCENLIISVVEYVYREHRQHKDVTVAAFLTERPYSEFPWTDLIGVIHESGFLTQLVRIAATRSGSLAPSVYSSVAGASIFIAQCAYRVYEQQDSKFKIYPAVFLSHFKIKDVEKYVRPRAIIIEHKLAKSSLYPLKRNYRSSDEDKLELMDMAIVFWNLPLYDELDLNESIANSGLNTIIHINLLDFDKVDEMYIEDLEDLPGCCRSYFQTDFFPVTYSKRADLLNESDHN